MDPFTARATLEWLVEMGCDEAICAQPVNRYALPDRMPAAAKPAPLTPAAETVASVPQHVPPAHKSDPVTEAEQSAAGAATLEDLQAALSTYPHCELRLGPPKWP